MLIRTEAPADILAIDRLLKSVFETDAEANLVMSLRENSHLTLSLVACSDEGEVVGHVMFSPLTLQGEDHNWQGLAPLAVREDFRSQGIARSLMEEAFSSLRDFGYPACVVLGDQAFTVKSVLRLRVSLVFSAVGMFLKGHFKRLSWWKAHSLDTVVLLSTALSLMSSRRAQPSSTSPAHKMRIEET